MKTLRAILLCAVVAGALGCLVACKSQSQIAADAIKASLQTSQPVLVTEARMEGKTACGFATTEWAPFGKVTVWVVVENAIEPRQHRQTKAYMFDPPAPPHLPCDILKAEKIRGLTDAASL